MKRTNFADYKFTVKEGEPSTSGADDALTFLMCEPITSELSIVDDHGFLSIRLKKGTTVDQAHEVARYLQDHIEGISFTKL